MLGSLRTGRARTLFSYPGWLRSASSARFASGPRLRPPVVTGGRGLRQLLGVLWSLMLRSIRRHPAARTAPLPIREQQAIGVAALNPQSLCRGAPYRAALPIRIPGPPSGRRRSTACPIPRSPPSGIPPSRTCRRRGSFAVALIAGTDDGAEHKDGHKAHHQSHATCSSLRRQPEALCDDPVEGALGQYRRHPPLHRIRMIV